MADQQPEEVEALVDTLTIDGAALNEAQLSAFSNCDLQQLAELSQELHLNAEPQQLDGEVVMDVSEGVAEEIVEQMEIVEEEVVIGSERASTPEEILPDVGKVTNTVPTTKTVVPPLRPLTIAPKPAKVPITLKPVAGQQLLLLQGKNSLIFIDNIPFLFFKLKWR